MAKLSKWAIFLRAFLVVFLSGAATRSGTADEGEQAAWAEAQRHCDTDAYFTYLSRYPSGEYVHQALIALSELGALQVAEQDALSSFCRSPVRELPAIPVPVPVQANPVRAKPGPPEGSVVLY